MNSNNGWWENRVDSPEEEDYWNEDREIPFKIPLQKDLNSPCYCDISYVCDECKKTRRKKIMTAI